MENIIKFVILILFLTSCSFGILENKKVSLQEAISYAKETNPQNIIRKLEIAQAKNDIKSSTRLQNPSIGTSQNIGDVAIGNPQQVGVDYVVEILKRGKRKNLSKTKLNVVENNQKLNEADLIYNVKVAYYNLLNIKSNLKIAKEQCNLQKEILDNIEKEYKNNKVPKTELIQAKIAYNRALMYVSTAQSEVISSQNRFNTVINSNDTDFDTLEDGLKDNYEELLTLKPNDSSLDFEALKKYALLNRADIVKAQKEVEYAKKNLTVVKSNLIPDVELSGGYSYLTKGTSDFGKFTSGAYAELSLINIPLVYRYQNEIENAKIEIKKAQLNYEDRKIDALRDITDAWERFSIAKTNLIFYNKELLKNSKELLDEIHLSLNKQEIDLTNFLITKKLYFELNLGYQNALYEYYLAFAELLKELNLNEPSQIPNI